MSKDFIIIQNKKVPYVGPLIFKGKKVKVYRESNNERKQYFFYEINGKLVEIPEDERSQIQEMLKRNDDVVYSGVKCLSTKLNDSTQWEYASMRTQFQFDNDETKNFVVVSGENKARPADLSITSHDVIKCLQENMGEIEKIGLPQLSLYFIKEKCNNFYVILEGQDCEDLNLGCFTQSQHKISIFPYCFEYGDGRSTLSHELFHLMAANDSTTGIDSFNRCLNEMLTEDLTRKIHGSNSAGYPYEIALLRTLFSQAPPKELYYYYFQNDANNLFKFMVNYFNTTPDEINYLLDIMDMYFNVMHYSSCAESKNSPEVITFYKQHLIELTYDLLRSRGVEPSETFSRIFELIDHLDFDIFETHRLITSYAWLYAMELDETIVAKLKKRPRSVNYYTEILETLLQNGTRIDNYLYEALIHIIPAEFLIFEMDKINEFFIENHYTPYLYKATQFFCLLDQTCVTCNLVYLRDPRLVRNIVADYLKTPGNERYGISSSTITNLYSQLSTLEKSYVLSDKENNFDFDLIATMAAHKCKFPKNNLVVKNVISKLCNQCPQDPLAWDHLNFLFDVAPQDELKFFNQICGQILDLSFDKKTSSALQKRFKETAVSKGCNEAFNSIFEFIEFDKQNKLAKTNSSEQA